MYYMPERNSEIEQFGRCKMLSPWILNGVSLHVQVNLYVCFNCVAMNNKITQNNITKHRKKVLQG